MSSKVNENIKQFQKLSRQFISDYPVDGKKKKDVPLQQFEAYLLQSDELFDWAQTLPKQQNDEAYGELFSKFSDDEIIHIKKYVSTKIKVNLTNIPFLENNQDIANYLKVDILDKFMPEYPFDDTQVIPYPITLGELESYLLSHQEVLDWAVKQEVKNHDGEYGLLFDKFDSDELLTMSKFLRKAFDIKLIEAPFLDSVDSDIEDNLEDENVAIDSDYVAYKNINKKTQGRKASNERSVTEIFCKSINELSEPMSAEEEKRLFKEWAESSQVFMKGVASVPALLEHWLVSLEDKLDSADVGQATDNMKRIIKNIDNVAFSNDELAEIQRLAEEAAYAKIKPSTFTDENQVQEVQVFISSVKGSRKFTDVNANPIYEDEQEVSLHDSDIDLVENSMNQSDEVDNFEINDDFNDNDNDEELNNE